MESSQPPTLMAWLVAPKPAARRLLTTSQILNGQRKRLKIAISQERRIAISKGSHTDPTPLQQLTASKQENRLPWL